MDERFDTFILFMDETFNAWVEFEFQTNTNM
jgi:hypothetical protein